MTLAEKILAAHTEKDHVEPGEFISVRVDLVMANEITGPIAIGEFERLGAKGVFDPQRVAMVVDHTVPSKDVVAAEQAKLLRDFSREHGLVFLDAGKYGIEHVVLPEQGLVVPGDVVIAADSHTCTYGALGAFATGMGSTDIACAMATGDTWMKVPSTMKLVYRGKMGKWVTAKDLILYTIGDIGVDGALYCAMEFCGEAIDDLSMDGRFTMANMAIEAGGKAGLFRVDEKTLSYVQSRAKRPFTVFEPDPDAQYARVVEYDVSAIEPQVAFPHLPSNTRPISQVGEVEIQQAVIGSCTNGRLEDLRLAAKVLKGRRVHPDIRCLIIPGSWEVYLGILREGLVEAFIQAGATVTMPTCGPCGGFHQGVLAAGERCISTTNRNFVGRMGSTQSEVYLANPAVAAASAILGRIGGPEEAIG